jgi:hypothetical protein
MDLFQNSINLHSLQNTTGRNTGLKNSGLGTQSLLSGVGTAEKRVSATALLIESS